MRSAFLAILQWNRICFCCLAYGWSVCYCITFIAIFFSFFFCSFNFIEILCWCALLTHSVSNYFSWFGWHFELFLYNYFDCTSSEIVYHHHNRQQQHTLMPSIYSVHLMGIFECCSENKEIQFMT